MKGIIAQKARFVSLNMHFHSPCLTSIPLRFISVFRLRRIQPAITSPRYASIPPSASICLCMAHAPSKHHTKSSSNLFLLWSSPRPISTSQLHVLPHFHPKPINLVVCKGSYFLRMGYLILRGASRLDAFSVYPCRTWLPCSGFGNPTGTPAVRPSRSSRTKDSSSQISYAHAG